jgi:murein tripeptide amidase MpaA
MPMPHLPCIRRVSPALLLTSLAISAPMTLAQNQPVERIDLLTQPIPTAYEDHMVVSVRITSVEQLEAALDLAVSSWTERPGLGKVDLQIHADQFDALDKLGVNPIVEIRDLQAHNQNQWESLVQQEQLDIINQSGAFKPQGVIQRGASTHDESWFSNYKQLADIYTYMDTQLAAHPDMVSKADFGDTIESRDMFAYTITAPDEPGNLAADRPIIIWNGGQHAREWVSPMTVTYIASRLINDAATDPEVDQLLKDIRFVIIPVLNPDGYLYSWSSERYWRKNRRDNPGSSFGVDLNRNWNVAWSGDGASSDPFDDTYYGTAPFSEPETNALSTLAQSFGDDLVAHIDYHTYSQLILWPLGYEVGLVTPEPDRSFFQSLSGDMSDLIQSHSGAFYDPIQSWQLYAAAGTCSDWFYAGAGVPSFTVELRPEAGAGFGGFDPPASVILPTAQENWEAAKLFAHRTTQAMTLAHEALEIVHANTPTPVTLISTPGISEIVPSSAMLNARIGSSGAFTQTLLTDSGSSEFTGHLPGAPCGQMIEYYFSATSLSGVSMTFPADGESSPLSALSQEITIAFEDDMESNTGWVVGQPSDNATTGIWERADPESTQAQPENDHTPGSGTLCWITDGAAGGSVGANDIDGGATTLTSPLMDATGLAPGAELVYWRWYSNDAGASPNEDSMIVEISTNDGGSWSTLETVTENAGAWVEKRFPAPDSDQLRVRFIASDLGSGSIVEAGVDDLRIESVGCPESSADVNGDGDLNFLDVSMFLSLFGSQDPVADFNGDGQWNFLDVSAFLAAFAAG